MRTTIDIDDELLEEAKRLTSVKTKKELINLSLSELIRKKRLEHLLSLFGTNPIELTLKDIEKFREDALGNLLRKDRVFETGIAFLYRRYISL